MTRLLLAVLLLVGSGCVSKTLYLQKIDEALRATTRAEQCARSLQRLADIRVELEQRGKALERKLAVAALERDGCRQGLARLEAEIAALRTQVRQRSDEVNELRAELALAREKARGLEARIARMREEARREPDLSDVLEALRAEVATTEGMSLHRRKGAVVVRIPRALLFRRRTTTLLSRSGRALVGRLADALGRLKERSFLVEGHQVPGRVPRRFRSPEELSLGQAVAVGIWLVRSGIDASRVSATGLGASRPVEADEPAERGATERIEIVVTPTRPADRLDVIGPQK